LELKATPGKFECDSFFPEIDGSKFEMQILSSTEENGMKYQFQMYKKK